MILNEEGHLKTNEENLRDHFFENIRACLRQRLRSNFD